jgi:hypothetical protein
MKSVRALWVGILLIAVGFSGCLFVPAEGPFYAYVFKIGPAKKIGAWTLQQVRRDSIDDGAAALADLTRKGGSAFPSADVQEAEDAKTQLITVIRKIESGWEGMEIWDDSSKKYVAMSSLPADEARGWTNASLKALYSDLASCIAFQAKRPEQRGRTQALDVMLAVKPEHAGELLSEWQRQMERAKSLELEYKIQ